MSRSQEHRNRTRVQKKSKGEVLTWYPPDLPGTYLLVRLARLPPSDFSEMNTGNDELWELRTSFIPTAEHKDSFSADWNKVVV
jgi:hypothetical protein